MLGISKSDDSSEHSVRHTYSRPGWGEGTCCAEILSPSISGRTMRNAATEKVGASTYEVQWSHNIKFM